MLKAEIYYIYETYYVILFLANILWNTLQIMGPDTVGVWKEVMGNANHKTFKDTKERIEQQVH